MRLNISGNRRSGVALIIVLGLLSLLLILAFAFTISMQVERVGSTTSTDGMQARASILQAFAMAARDISYHIGTYPPRTWVPARWPPSAWTPGGQYAGGDSRAQAVDGMQITASNWVPVARMREAMVAATNVKWRTMFALGGASGYLLEPAGYKGVPRYAPVNVAPILDEPVVAASLSLNCSGMLDPHTAGRAQRRYGTDPAEIQISTNATIQAVIAGEFTKANPAESYLEMTRRLQAKGYPKGDPTGRLFPFSHYPIGQYTSATNLRQSVYVGDGVAALSTPARARAVMDAFDDAGFRGTIRKPDGGTVQARLVRGWLYTNLLDYVDNDRLPRSLRQPCQEDVPMLNEVGVRSTYSCARTPTNYQFTVQDEIIAELWMPHVFSIPQANVRASTGQIVFDLVSHPFGGLVQLPDRNDLPVSQNPPNLTMNQRQMTNQTLTVGAGLPRNARTFYATNYLAYQSIRYRLRVPWVAVMRGSDQVDLMNGALTVVVTNSLPPVPPSIVGRSTQSVMQTSIECLDPRFNWDPADRSQWRPATNSTLGRPNEWAVNYIRARTDGCDADDLMYCANGMLQTVGEIGYLVYQPWRTVRLFDLPGRTGTLHRVLDTFTVGATNQISMKGLVNPNSEFADVIASVFYKMPVDRFPGDTVSTSGVPWNLAMEIGRGVTNHTTGRFMNQVSELGGVDDVFQNLGLLQRLGATNEFTRESLLRNSAGLFNTRQMLFTTILCSGYVSAEHEFGGRANRNFHYRVNEDAVRSSERRAVAVFWFDTLTGESFVRFFKYLDN